jgi:hypothetical protein
MCGMKRNNQTHPPPAANPGKAVCANLNTETLGQEGDLLNDWTMTALVDVATAAEVTAVIASLRARAQPHCEIVTTTQALGRAS